MSERSKWDSDDTIEKSPRYSQASMALLSESNSKIRENPWASISPRPKRQVNSFARFASDVRPIVQNIWTGKVRARPKSARTTLPPSRPSEWAQHSPAVESQRGDNSTAMAPPSPDLPPSTERRHANADHFSPTALGQPADAGRGDPSHGLSQSAPSGPLAHRNEAVACPRQKSSRQLPRQPARRPPRSRCFPAQFPNRSPK